MRENNTICVRSCSS